MRSLVLLSILGLTAAVSPAEQGDCLVDSGEAVSDATDAALFIWAATKRCGKTSMVLKCEIDVASAIKSVNGMINVILKAVDKCDGLHTANKECGLEAGKLTKHVAGLAAAAGIVDQKCITHKNAQGMKEYAAPVMCTIDIKDSLKQLFKAIKGIRKAQSECKHEDKRYCASNSMDIVSSFAGFGGYLAGAIGQCKRTTAVNKNSKVASTRDELCAQAAQDLVHHTMEVAESGTDLSRKCEAAPAPAPAEPDTVVIEEESNGGEVAVLPPGGESNGGFGLRVVTTQKPDTVITYIQTGKENGQPALPISSAARLFEVNGMASTSSANLILGAFLPVTAIVGFVGGRVYASRRSQQTREFMSDNE